DEPVTRAELLESELNRWIELRRKEDATPFRTPAPHLLRRAALTAFADELRTGGLDRFAEPGLGPPSPDPGLDAPMTEAAALFGNERPLSERPTPWNGEIRDPLARSAIAARYHERYEWSASQLEQYGRRPFDHLVERVLGFSELDETEDEASRLTLGGLVHEVLERFYAGIDPTELVDAGADSPAQLRFDRTFREVCDRYEAAEDRWIGVPYVWAATRQELYARLSSFVRWELGQSDGARPLAVELEFGGRTDRGPADLSGLARDGVERTLLLGGRVDRIDRIGSDGGRGLRVVDYKSGGAGSAPSPRAFEDGAALQSPLYMAAVEALGLGAAIAGVYRTIRAPANRARRRPADVGPALELARLIPARIRAGLFEAVQARSTELRDWQPGRDIARTAARLGSGTRFDPLAPARVPGAAMATHEDREPERAP
ncbi:MAG: PD-(D/E)XK nuclease family protein, partial [Gemmatimonadetes bacterium]|nr:PD-(D/E)XK nuclease family protein [Gemmatimonadota bacterium]